MTTAPRIITTALCVALFAMAGCPEPRGVPARDGAAPDAATTEAAAPRRPEVGREAETGAGDAAIFPAREVTIAASGDVLIHRKVVGSAQAHDGGFRYVLGALGETIGDVGPGPVVTVVNLETPLTEAHLSPVNTLPPVLGSPPELGAVLRELGVDLISVANNHAMDQTSAGLADTLRTAHEAGLAVVGGGPGRDAAYRPWITEQNSLRVAFVGFTDHVNRGPGRGDDLRVALLRETEAVMASVARAREQADVVVVALHWGSDYTRRPIPSQRRLAGRLIEAGADLIVGSGPHVLHDVERLPSPRGEALVAYSLGNLISNQGLHHRVGERIRRGGHPVAVTPGTRDVVLLAVRIRSPERGRVELVSVDAHVMWTLNNFWERRRNDEVATDVRLVRLRDASEAVRTERLEAVRRALGEAVRLVP